MPVCLSFVSCHYTFLSLYLLVANWSGEESKGWKSCCGCQRGFVPSEVFSSLLQHFWYRKKPKLKPVLQLVVSYFLMISFHCHDQYPVFGVHSPDNSCCFLFPRHQFCECRFSIMVAKSVCVCGWLCWCVSAFKVNVCMGTGERNVALR